MLIRRGCCSASAANELGQIRPQCSHRKKKSSERRGSTALRCCRHCELLVTRFPALAMLRLSGSVANVTPVGVGHLARLPALEHLEVIGTSAASALPGVPAALAHAGRLTHLSITLKRVRPGLLLCKLSSRVLEPALTSVYGRADLI